MEHYYQTIGQDWFNYHDLYKSIVETFPEGSHFVEVGCWKGRSAAFLGVEIKNSNKNIKLDCVDHWKGSWEHLKGGPVYDPITDDEDSLYNEFLKNTELLRDVINPVRMSSLDACKLYSDESLDFVFIDAGHEYDDVKDDILSWLPKVKKGGILAGHDFSNDSPGIIRAVNELLPGFERVSLICWKYIKP